MDVVYPVFTTMWLKSFIVEALYEQDGKTKYSSYPSVVKLEAQIFEFGTS